MALKTFVKLVVMVLANASRMYTGIAQRLSVLLYSTYISQVFDFANFANLESFTKLFQQKFRHFEVEPH